MLDFTIRKYLQLIEALIAQGYSFQTFQDFLVGPKARVIVLRHDVDDKMFHSLLFAKIQNEMGIKGTYYFRMVPQSYDEKVILEIAELGHEIGYHYEDMFFASKKFRKAGIQKHNIHEEDLYETAIELFKTHLEKLRKLYPVQTICMHGRPLSRFDNKSIWKKYNYRQFGIIGEPYFDVIYSKVLYLTDTGRSWDGSRFSVRDKIEYDSMGIHFHSTDEIIAAALVKKLPDKIIFTFHPQRWHSGLFEWHAEMLTQWIKNWIKFLIIKKRSL